MIKMVSAQLVHPSDEVLTAFRSLDPTAVERPLRTARLDYLRKQFDAGLLLNPPKWASVYCRSNGRRYRVNGQHTAQVLSERPAAIRPAVVLERYECDTMDEVATLFSTFDSRESARSLVDVNRAVFSADASLADLPVRTGGAIVSGVSLLAAADREWETGVRIDGSLVRREQTAVERARAVAPHAGFAAWFIAEFAHKDAKALFERAPVIAAMLATRRRDQAAAEIFWTESRDGSNPNPKSGSRLLREYLLGVRLSSSSAANSRNAAGQREVLSKCLTAWNAWRTGTPIQRLSYRETSLLPEVE